MNILKDISTAPGDISKIENRPAHLEDNPSGYVEYRYMMFALPLVMNAHRIVETGLSMGESTCIWLESLSRMDGDRRLCTYELPSEKNNLSYIEDKIRALNFKADWQTRWQDSVEGASVYSDLPVDLLYLDSDHTYEQVWNELEAWSRHLHDKSIILGDDIWLNDPQNHSRLNKRNGGNNPIDVYYAAHDWAVKNNWKETYFTYPNGKFLLTRF